MAQQNNLARLKEELFSYTKVPSKRSNSSVLKMELFSYVNILSKVELVESLFLDSLTKTLNRAAFNLAKPKPYIAIIDLDSLKYVNDNAGHRQGDRCLIKLAEALKQRFNHVYRLSGDEFVILLDQPNYVALALVQEALSIFSFGIGVSLEDADTELRQNKLTRVKSGERAIRGERPPWY